jgi:Tol biopolymer transport system component
VTRVVALLIGAALCASAAAAGQAPDGRVVFASASGTQGQVRIWEMNANGRARHALTSRTTTVDSPALSHDGSHVAFVWRGDIYVMRDDGSHVRRLTYSAAIEGAPAWSFDDRMLAYSRYGSSHSAILKMRPDGGGKTRLTPPALADVPAWSPLDSRIAYAGPRGHVWVMHAHGSQRHELTHTKTGVDWAPSWAPDGLRVAYESDTATGPANPTNEIWVVNWDGAEPTRLTHNALDDSHPVWSPDSRWLLFSSARPHPGRLDLWLMHPNGKGLRRLTSWRGEQYWPSWAR